MTAFRSRFPWLLCNIGGGIMAAFLSGVFQEELQRVVALAMFVPVVLGLAESVSIQSVSLTLQILHGHPPAPGVLLKKLKAELLTGMMLGLASAAMVAVVSFLWLRNGHVAICLLVGITGGIATAAVIGMAMPNILRMFRRDPQVAAGPIALASADMVTLLVYFTLSRWIA